MNEKNLERVEAQLLENTERRVAELAAAVPQPGQGSLECSGCFDAVAPARAALGYRTCILCAEAQERLSKIYTLERIDRRPSVFGADLTRHADEAAPAGAEPPE